MINYELKYHEERVAHLRCEKELESLGEELLSLKELTGKVFGQLHRVIYRIEELKNGTTHVNNCNCDVFCTRP